MPMYVVTNTIDVITELVNGIDQPQSHVGLTANLASKVSPHWESWMEKFVLLHMVYAFIHHVF